MRIPVAAIKQEILDWIDQHERLHPKVKKGEEFKGSKDIAIGGSAALAHASGIDERSLYRVLNESTEVQENTVEKIFIVGMGRPDLWRVCVEPHLHGPPTQRRQWTDDENDLIMSDLPVKKIAHLVNSSDEEIKLRRRVIRRNETRRRKLREQRAA